MSFLKNLLGKKDPGEHPLRTMALRATAEDLQVVPTPDHPNVFGMIMDHHIPMAGGVTVVAFVDGAVSMYWGERGGIIGAGEHESVRQAAEQWLAIGQKTYDNALPGQGDAGNEAVRIIWRGFTEDRHAIATTKDFMSPKHPLSVLFAAAQNVITQIRLVDQARRR